MKKIHQFLSSIKRDLHKRKLVFFPSHSVEVINVHHSLINMWHFSLQRQRDPRLNEILFPFFDLKRAQQIIDTHEPSDDARSQGVCSQRHFSPVLKVSP